MRTKDEIIKSMNELSPGDLQLFHNLFIVLTALVEIVTDMRDLQKEELDYYKGGVEDLEPKIYEVD